MLKKIFLCASLFAIAAQASIPSLQDFLTEQVTKQTSKIDLSWLEQGCAKIGEDGAANDKTVVLKNLKDIMYKSYKDCYWMIKELGRVVDFSELTKANKNYILIGLVTSDMFFNTNMMDKDRPKLDRALFDKLCDEAKRLHEWPTGLKAALFSSPDWEETKNNAFKLLSQTGICNAMLRAFLNKKIDEVGAQKYKADFEAAMRYAAHSRLRTFPGQKPIKKGKKPHVDIQHLPINFIKILHSQRYKFYDGDIEDSAASGNLEIIKFFVEDVLKKEKRKKVLENMFWKAVQGEQLEVLDYLLEKDPKLIAAEDENGLTPLSLASEKGNEALVDLLVRKVVAKRDASPFFFDAIRHGQVYVVKSFLGLAPRLIYANKDESERTTPLKFAKNCKRPELVEYLKDFKLRVDPQGLLNDAIKDNDVDEVKYLLAKKPDMLKNEGYKKRILSEVAHKGNLELVKLLVEPPYNAEINLDIWFEAIRSSKVEFVKYLLDQKQELLDDKDSNGRTAFSYAARGGTLDIVRLLVEKYNVDVTLDALNEAVEGNDVVIVEYLLGKLGKNSDISDIINDEDEDGRTPLSYAARYRKLDVVKFLVDKGAEVNLKALLWAIRGDNVKVAEYMLDEKPELIDAKAENGKTLLEFAEQWHRRGAAITNCLSEYAGVDIYNLLWAINDDKVKVAKYMLGKNPKLGNAKDRDGRTPLSLASCKGNLALVRLLVEKYNAEINLKALNEAIEGDDVKIVKYLLDEKPELIDARDGYGRTPLEFADQWHRGEADIIECLRKYAEVNIDNLLWAMRSNKVKVAEYMLGKDPTLSNAKNGDGWTVLLLMAYEGKPEFVQLLIDKGAKVDIEALRDVVSIKNVNLEVVRCLLNKNSGIINTKSKDGSTPLSVASYTGNLALVQLLVGAPYNADVTFEALLRAVKSNKVELVEYLLEQKSSIINDKDEYGGTALSWAASAGNLDIVQLLVNPPYNADVTLDALLWAVKRDYVSVVEYLLDEKPDLIDAKAENGKTALEVANWYGRAAIIECLRKYAEVNIDNLLWAIRKQKVRVVEYMLDKAPTLIDAKAKNGETPLQMAEKCRNSELVEFLKNFNKE